MENNEQKQTKNLFSIPLTGCLYVIILAALASMSIKGCKMVGMKYEEQKAKHEIVMDSLNEAKAHKLDSLQYKGR